MTNRELDEEKNKIEHIMSTKSLSKKEQSELNARLNKITRAKLESGRPIKEDSFPEEGKQKTKELEDELARIRQKMNQVRSERAVLFEERNEIEDKKQDIKDDISNFFEKLNELADIVDSNVETGKLKEESKVLKEGIYKLRSDIGKVNDEFSEKVRQYETEQEKIKWIAWASKIQEKRREEWEDEKADRKRQKNR